MNANEFVAANKLKLFAYEIDRRSDGTAWTDDPDGRHFLCVLTRRVGKGIGTMGLPGIHRAMTFEYSQGSLVNGSPTVAGVLENLSSEAGGADLTFGEWCQDFDYSDDSIAARSVYEACRRTRSELLRVLGEAAFEQLQGVDW